LQKNAFKEGFTRIISFGGDGTHNEVLNGVLLSAEEKFGKTVLNFSDEEKDKLPTLAVVSIGSGNNFRKTLKLPKDVKSTLKIVFSNSAKPIDVGGFRIHRFLGKSCKKIFPQYLKWGIFWGCYRQGKQRKEINF